MYKKVAIVFIAFFLLTCLANVALASNDRQNPSRQEVERLIDEVARKRGIPTVILKSVARVESVFKQYNSDGSVYTGSRGSIGIMQINNRGAGFDTRRLKYDIPYNIEAGATMLLRKWDTCVRKLPQFKNMDPNILEHWYFALWAYNGWSESNNPNMIPYKYSSGRVKKYSYQELVFTIAEREYKQPIAKINTKQLPKRGLPSKGLILDTPKDFHYGDIDKYDTGDIVAVSCENSLKIRDSAGGKQVGSLNPDDVLYVIDKPNLQFGYYWYKVKLKDSDLQGYVAGNWITKIGEVKEETCDENAPFKDVSKAWGLEYITKLKDMGIISGASDHFYPNKTITRQEFSVMIAKALKLGKMYIELTYEDKDTIKPWALEYVKSVTAKNFFYGFEDNKFRPNYNITREEMSKILSTIVGLDDLDIKLNYKDLDKASPKNVQYIMNVHSKNLMNGDTKNNFNPNKPLTRQEACKIIVGLLDYIDKVKK
ncbi:S-layer homology domain-containing protein [Clostridiaceae bacterium M8S5]|nr:S-layer homology domain-containing protein [Clostridiaceae bacterium M8S5]